MSYRYLNLGDKRLKFFKNPIGEGSYAKVFHAIDLDNDVSYAIKILNLKKIDTKLIKRINVEINIIKELKHKNIVECHYSFSTDDYIYIFMEYCMDGTIGDYIKHNNISEEQARYFMEQIKSAMIYLREKNIMHRDLKTSNILLKKENDLFVVKICDFGFAKKIMNDIELSHTICGTPLYMSPEIIMENKYNFKSDLWSIGVILYELIYKKYPYISSNITELKLKINSETPQYDPSIDISSECRNLMEMLLTYNVNNRIDWNEFINHPWFNKIFKYENNIDVLKICKEKDKKFLYESYYGEPTTESTEIIRNDMFNNKLICYHSMKDQTRIIKYNNENKVVPFSSLDNLIKENYFSVELDNSFLKNSDYCIEKKKYINIYKKQSFTDTLMDYFSSPFFFIKKII